MMRAGKRRRSDAYSSGCELSGTTQAGYQDVPGGSPRATPATPCLTLKHGDQDNYYHDFGGRYDHHVPHVPIRESFGQGIRDLIRQFSCLGIEASANSDVDINALMPE